MAIRTSSLSSSSATPQTAAPPYSPGKGEACRSRALAAFRRLWALGSTWLFRTEAAVAVPESAGVDGPELVAEEAVVEAAAANERREDRVATARAGREGPAAGAAAAAPPPGAAVVDPGAVTGVVVVELFVAAALEGRAIPR